MSTAVHRPRAQGGPGLAWIAGFAYAVLFLDDSAEGDELGMWRARKWLAAQRRQAGQLTGDQLAALDDAFPGWLQAAS